MVSPKMLSKFTFLFTFCSHLWFISIHLRFFKKYFLDHFLCLSVCLPVCLLLSGCNSHLTFYFSPNEFFIPIQTVDFSLEFKWQFLQVFRNLLNIGTDFNNAVIWIVSILPLEISTSSSLFSRLFWTVPRSTTTVGITVTFMFHGFF